MVASLAAAVRAEAGMSRERDPEEMLSSPQREMAAGIGAVLGEFSVRYTETVENVGNEFWPAFHVATLPGSGLDVKIAIITDSVHFHANEAEARFDWAAWNLDTARWINDVPAELRTLFRHDLRIRVRRTLFGHLTGAVWFPGASAGDGSWNGDRAATRGKGRERIFPKPWYVQKATR